MFELKSKAVSLLEAGIPREDGHGIFGPQFKKSAI
jgi:hypothetical protein